MKRESIRCPFAIFKKTDDIKPKIGYNKDVNFDKKLSNKGD